MGRMRQFGNSFSGGSQTTGDSLRRRDKLEDSITIRFRYLDSTRISKLDSSVSDFSKRFPIPATHIFLGNTGSASRSILFSPKMNAGWDPGFHAFDIYKWTLQNARIVTTTRPYSEINYLIGARAEQVIELVHTQNLKPNWNVLAQYRLINSPGFFKNQKTNHNNYLITSWFQTMDKRYNASVALVSNKLQAGENGGMQNIADLKDPVYRDRFNIPTNIGGDATFGTNFFSTDVGTGNRYKEFSVLLRQQYDLGQKDSIVTDSTVIPLFYPRLRFEHVFQYNRYAYNFRDYVADSAYYHDNFGVALNFPTDSFQMQDRWKEFINDFSIYQYPDAKNLHQFIKLGAAIQNFSLRNSIADRSFINVFGHAEYRNRTRNQAWDIEAKGKLYFSGFNAGDYHAYITLQRFFGKRRSYALIGFENVNRTPSFIFDKRSEFNFTTSTADFKKENTVRLFASLFPAALKLKIEGNYYLLTNYTYLTSYYELQQESSLFTMLQLSLQKTIKLGKHWFWHSDVYFQQTIGNAPVNVPTIFTRNRIGYEGSLGYKNLDIAFGLDTRYHTPYKADGYSPVLGQFYYQDSVTIKNPLPDIALYVHLRIRAVKFYVRGENINSLNINNGFNFTNNNLAAPGYAYPGFFLRLGVYWSFVN